MGFSGQAPGEILYPDPAFGHGCFPLSLGVAGWEGLSWEGAEVGRPEGLGAGLGETGRSLIHPPGMAPLPGSLEPSRGRPPSTALLVHQPRRPALPFPAQHPLPSCLWSGRGPWQSQPCGPGSPWLLGPFTRCPWVPSGSPCGLTRTTEVSLHPGLASAHRPLLFSKVRRRGASIHTSHSRTERREAARVPLGQSLPLPTLASQPLC